MSDPSLPKRLAADAEAAYPNRNGEELAHRLPFPKACALVIDDHADSGRAGGCRSAVETLKDTKIPHSSENGPGDEGRTLLDLYEFVSFAITYDELRATDSCSCGTAGIVRKALVEKGDLRRFDLILLDLSLGEKRGEDPAGYQLLPILRKFFPLIPIIAYTKYRDMGHIERAFRRGASWFLSKEETHKLPAHHLELIDNPNWRREWNGVKDRIEWELPAGEQFEEYERHLIWKTVEHMPGGRIYVRPLSGGIGGARTLHCSREINGDYDLAAPVVIKIDDRFPMLLERWRYQRFIRPYLSNLAGRIDVPLHVGGGNKGAIAYTYAGTSQGRRGSHREVLPLERLLQMNLPGANQEILDAHCYEKLFDYLLDEVLGRIHSVNPEGEPSEVDFPNLVFWESPTRPGTAQKRAGERESLKGSALDAYMMRMPAEFEHPLEKPFSEPMKNGDKPPIYVYGIERGENAHIQGLVRLGDGLLHRIDLKGLLGPFYAEHRYLRPMQPLWCEGWPPKEAGGEGDGGRHFRKQWVKLWVPKQKTFRHLSLCKRRAASEKNVRFTLRDAMVTGGEKLGTPRAIMSLFTWLTKQGESPREALEAGKIGIVHGDMNLGNVMVERERGEIPKPVNSAPWLIDFARTRRDWIVQDYTQLELDLCMRLVRFEFFRDLKESVKEALKDPQNAQGWESADEFVTHFLETPWQDPPCARDEPRLQFIYRLMRQVRNGADRANIRTEEYLASRVWQCLITHKILCGKWRKKKDDTLDPELQFRCVWSLKQAFQTARVLGWRGE